MQPNSLPASPAPRRDAGFTAVELLVVIAIVAILAALAMPGFRGVVDRYRVRQATEDLTAMIYQARSEAIRRGGRVTLRKATPADCTTESVRDWSCGWLVFVDANEDGMVDAGEEELHSSPAPKGVDVKLVLRSGQASMIVDAWGQFSGMGAFRMELEPKGSTNTDLQMRLCMSGGGRLRTLSGDEQCS